MTRDRTEAPAPKTARSSDQTTYLVLEDFGTLGRAYRETDPSQDFEGVIGDLLTGQFDRPLRVIAFNIREGWARDVSSQVAAELIERSRRANSSLNVGALNFLISLNMKRRFDHRAGEITRGQMCLFSNDELESV